MSKKSFCRSITYRYLDLKRTKTETSYISDISYQIYNINLFTILMQCCFLYNLDNSIKYVKVKKYDLFAFHDKYIEVTDELLIPNLHIYIRFYMYISYSKVWLLIIYHFWDLTRTNSEKKHIKRYLIYLKRRNMSH